MKEAEAAERAGYVATRRAIIHNTIGLGVEEEDGKRTWEADAEECKKRSSIETAKSIYGHALIVFLTKKSTWLKAAQLEKRHGNKVSLDALLRKAVTYRPQAEVLWLMVAKEKWLAGDLSVARAILQEAYAAIPTQRRYGLQLLSSNLGIMNLREQECCLLRLEKKEVQRVWMKLAIVERELGNSEEETRSLDDGLTRFPSFFKLWLMLGLLEEQVGKLENTKRVCESGLKHIPSCIPFWLSLSILEEEMKGIARARAVLTLAMRKNPQQPEIWLAAVGAESRHGYEKEADTLMAKAMQECPNSGVFWAAAIEMVPRSQRKSKSVDAFKKFERDTHVVAAVAELLWLEREVDKARSYLHRAVTLALDIGDFWALYYKFELQHGNEENLKDVLQRCVAAEPKHGEKWQAISKAVENTPANRSNLKENSGRTEQGRK